MLNRIPVCFDATLEMHAIHITPFRQSRASIEYRREGVGIWIPIRLTHLEIHSQQLIDWIHHRAVRHVNVIQCSCIYKNVYVWMFKYINMYIDMRTHTYINIYMYLYICVKYLHVLMSIQIYMYIYLHTYTYIYIYTNMNIYINIWIYLYIYISRCTWC